MNTKSVAKTLGGAIAVYVIMAACGASDHGGTGATAEGGSGSLDGALGVLKDALVNPVDEAAAGNPPDIVTEACDKTFTPNGGSLTYYAEHAYPGKTKAELLLVRTGVNVPASTQYPPGYTTIATTDEYVKDGFVGVTCGGQAGVTVFFVLPQ